ncbi:MAG: hypothetical protein NC453_29245 [Muribaculum sp.]|nr:hypothetical protein [Muribaculum sp.]
MKHPIKIFFFTMMLALLPTLVTAQALPTVYGTLTKVCRDNTEIPTKRQRTPSLPIAYTISQEEGLQIMSSSISSDDIIEFEIYDLESDECLFSFTDEQSFTQTLFILSGDYQIRLATPDYELISDISL